MSSYLPTRQANNPCLQIQVDLSAMLDGELDAASIRRVMVHSDVCESCKTFMQSIRVQAQAHRDMHEALVEDPSTMDSARATRAKKLRKQLMANRQQLAKILYELGRGFVFMGLSPSFSRVVAREPVPVPDMCLRGRNFLDEMQRSGDPSAADWVAAKDLFGPGQIDTPSENLAKGMRLLREVLQLQPDYHSARIYLGHAHHVCGERESARREFETVLAMATDPVTRAFALENLGNVYLEEGQPSRSIPFFLELVQSSAIEKEPRFFTTYFNLALSYGTKQEFGECSRWLARLYQEYPHKRAMIGRELRTRSHFAEALAQHPQTMADFAASFPGWFPLTTEVH